MVVRNASRTYTCEAMPRVLILFAHPRLERSRTSRALLRHLPDRPDVQLRDLYELYPTFDVDIPREQALLAEHDIVVMQHPVYWYSVPPLMKQWIDLVLAFGWAYGPGGTALRGKDLWLAVSTGGPAPSYRPEGHNRHFFDAFLPPYEQTAALCGLRFVPPLVLHGAHRADAATVDAHVQVFGERLRRYPDWPELAELDDLPACEVPADARPAPEAQEA